MKIADSIRHLRQGKHSNSRIAFQSGAFLLFGQDATLDEGVQRFRSSALAVSNKRNVLKQLDQLNINESTVFPYIENSAKYIATKFPVQGSVTYGKRGVQCRRTAAVRRQDSPEQAAKGA